jgi:hypothetical protein
MKRRINRMKHIAALPLLLATGVILAQAQTPTPTTLPVYQVVKSGASETEAAALAKQLQIPAETLVNTHGRVSFIDAEKYLAVPKAPVTDAETIRRLREATKNKNPEREIRLRAVDAKALSELRVLDEKVALDTMARALGTSALRLQSATPVAGHNTLTFYSHENGGKWLAKSNRLDTTVNYKFTVESGHPLIGPGAQAQITYDGEGHVSHLLYAARQLKAGEQVKIVSESEARERIARKLPANAQITVRLVYWSPPLEPWLGRADGGQPTTIIPWYAYYGTTRVTNPNGSVSSIRSRVGMIPATDDARYVPAVTLSASVDSSTVRAHAVVRGGTPPYTYIWGGSDEAVSRSTGDTIQYTAQARATESLLRDPHFHLATTERVSVTVIDANGVAIHGLQIVPVHPHPNLTSHGPITGPSYGAESPADPGEWTSCRVGWQKGMSTSGAGGGTQSFAWLGDDAWPGDFIEPNPAGTLVATPWVNGDADYRNWGINTADLVIDIADGNADLKTAMQPGAPLSEYATAQLQSTALSNDVGINLNGYGTPAWYTVNYANAWGPTGPNDTLAWLLTDDCDMLDPEDGSGLNVAQRWGVAFNGLHVMAGFSSLDYGDGPFENAVADNILGVGGSPQTIVQSWFNAAQSTGAGTPAAIGPALSIGGGLFWMANLDDYYWGKGSVGPTIVPSSYAPGDVGWWYLNGSNSATLVFP